MVVSDRPARDHQPPTAARRGVDPKQVVIWTAVSAYLPGFEFKPACANVSAALRLDPLCVIRPRGYEMLAKHLIVKSGLVKRRHQLGPNSKTREH